MRGRALEKKGGSQILPIFFKLRILIVIFKIIRQLALRLIVKRETAQTNLKGL